MSCFLHKPIGLFPATLIFCSPRVLLSSFRCVFYKGVHQRTWRLISLVSFIINLESPLLEKFDQPQLHTGDISSHYHVFLWSLAHKLIKAISLNFLRDTSILSSDYAQFLTLLSVLSQGSCHFHSVNKSLLVVRIWLNKSVTWIISSTP